MLSSDERDKFHKELVGLGADEVNRRIKLGQYGAHSTPRRMFAQVFVDKAFAKHQQEYATENIRLLREANEKSEEANLISIQANTISEIANRK